MLLANRHLLDLTASDVMSTEVVTIPRHMSLQAASHRLSQCGISGAPVIDDAGKCVGVFSKTDLMRFFDQQAVASGGWDSCQGEVFADWQVLDLDSLPLDEVDRYMSTRMVTAPPNTRVAELARMMHEAHIHRILITDTMERVIGVVSSMDILRALAAEDALTSGHS